MSGQPIAPTERLSALDTYLFRFEGTVLGLRRAGEEHVEVALDRSAFYAASGGQPSDRGRLEGREVVAVLDEDGVIWHRFLSAAAGPEPVFLPGAAVTGEIDAQTRLDHMQQHTGQHILSQAFLRTAELPTVSFHLGPEESTIDLRGARPGPEVCEAALIEANDCVLADRAVRTHLVDREEVGRYPLRREPTAEVDRLRLIEIEDYDWSACGGTHARRTGEVGPIQILGVEKIRSDWRIRFVAGRRALAYLRGAHRVLDEIARAHSLHWTGIPEAARAWKEAAGAAEREVRRLREERGAVEGERLWRDAPEVAGGRAAAFWAGERTAEELRALAARFTEPGPSLLLAGGAASGRSHWVCARGGSGSVGPDFPPADQLLREWLEEIGGKGGGSGSFARGTGPEGGAAAEGLPERLRDWWRARLARLEGKAR